MGFCPKELERDQPFHILTFSQSWRPSFASDHSRAAFLLWGQRSASREVFSRVSHFQKALWAFLDFVWRGYFQSFIIFRGEQPQISFSFQQQQQQHQQHWRLHSFELAAIPGHNLRVFLRLPSASQGAIILITFCTHFYLLVLIKWLSVLHIGYCSYDISLVVVCLCLCALYCCIFLLGILQM